MSSFSFAESQRHAAERLARARPVAGARRRRRRADAGNFRMHEAVQRKLTALLAGQERPSVGQVLRELRVFCRAAQLACPTRATVYAFMAHGPGHNYRLSDLPEAIRSCLYNLEGTAEVPGHQLAFYAFHYGATRALCFAAGLPWIDLYQAARLPAWRPRSRGLLEAVLLRRGI